MTTLGKRSDRIRQQQKKRHPNLFKTPKGYVLLMLSMLMVIAGVYSKDTSIFMHAGLAIVTAIILEILFAVWQQHKRIYPDGAVITGLIIAMVLGSTVAWYFVVFTTAVAMISKHLLKVNNRLIVNPAAFGLLVSSMLFSTEQSWWGSLSVLPVYFVIVLLITGFLVTKRVHKLLQVFSFLGSYFLFLFVMGILHVGNAGDALRVPYINTALFLAFFMLTDPPTSPAKGLDQIWFGLIASIVSVAIYMKFGGLIFPLLGLLIANVWTTWKKTRNRAKQRPPGRKTSSDDHPGNRPNSRLGIQ